MWDIIRLAHWRIPVALFLEEKDDMIQRMKSIRFICKLTCASWLPRLRSSGSEFDFDLKFGPVLSVDMVLGAHVVYPLEYSIRKLIALALGNSFGTW